MMYPLFAFSVMLFLAGCQSRPVAEPQPVASVKTARAARKDVRLLVRAPATVFAREQANVASRLTAPVREMPVRKGDSVSAGQLLARLENRDLLAQRMEAAAVLMDAEATLAKLSTGTLPTEIERARGQVATAEAALNQAQKFYDRRKQLYEQGAIPGRDLLVSETDLALARTNHEVAVKVLQLLENKAQERDLQIARSRVEQARGRLAFIDAQLSFTEIRSPFAGTVTEQFLFPGDMAKPDTAVFTVADLSIAVARAQVPESKVKSVQRGEACSFTPADQSQKEFAGTVSIVNRAVDAARRTVEVWCEIPNRAQQIRAGVFGTVTVITGLLQQVVVVPLPAVQFEEGSNKGVVVVVNEAGQALRRAVETNAAEAGEVALLSGVKEGEIVIVEGGYGLADGMAVKREEK